MIHPEGTTMGNIAESPDEGPSADAYKRWEKDMKMREEKRSDEQKEMRPDSQLAERKKMEEFWQKFEKLEPVSIEDPQEAMLERDIEREMVEQDIRYNIMRDLSARTKSSLKNKSSGKRGVSTVEDLQRVNAMLMKTSWGRRERTIRKKAEKMKKATSSSKPGWNSSIADDDTLDRKPAGLPKIRVRPRPDPYLPKMEENQLLLKKEGMKAAEKIIDNLMTGSKSLFSLTGNYSNGLQYQPEELSPTSPGSNFGSGFSTMNRKSASFYGRAGSAKRSTMGQAGTFMTGIGISDSSSSDDVTTNNVETQARNLPRSLESGTVAAPKAARLPEMMNHAINRLPFVSEADAERFRKRFNQQEALAIANDGFWFLVSSCFGPGTPQADRKRKFRSKKGHNRASSSLSSIPDDVASESQEAQEEQSRIRGAIFNRMAENFVNLFDSMLTPDDMANPSARGPGSLCTEKDFFMNMYPDGLAQTLYYSLVSAYPKSKENFSGEFPSKLKAIILDWTTGYQPYRINISHWINIISQAISDQDRMLRKAFQLKKKIDQRMENLDEMLCPQPMSRSLQRHRETADGTKISGSTRPVTAISKKSRPTTKASWKSKSRTAASISGGGQENERHESMPAIIDTKRVPFKIDRKSTTMYHSALMLHYLSVVRAASKKSHALITPISRHLTDGSGETDIVGNLRAKYKQSVDQTVQSMQVHHEAHKASEYEDSERPEYKERKQYVEAQRKKALRESQQYAMALLQHYQEKRYGQTNQAHLPGRGRASMSRLGGSGSRVVLQSK
mmetsp:Transcript_40593/g.65997  ORF Transcript_40593/g.65997 Transcript_40593/m.65997 type:complete len:788 (-) Transcript_40593:252-2615(-)